MDLEDFNLKVGATVGVKTVGGKLFYGTLSQFKHDKVTGEVTMKVDPRTVIDSGACSDGDCNSPGRCTITGQCRVAAGV